MKKIKRSILLSSVVLSLSLIFSIGFLQDANAVSVTLSDQISCETIGGAWVYDYICEIPSLTINSDEELYVASGVTLKLVQNALNPITISNYGTIRNYGSIHNEGSILNYGFIINHNHMFNQGLLLNSATVENNSVISNTGQIDNDNLLQNYGTLSNYGIMNNSIKFYNKGVFNQFSNTAKTSISGELLNEGTIKNVRGKIIISTGVLTNTEYIENSDTILISNPSNIGLKNHKTIMNLLSGIITISNTGGMGITNEKISIILPNAPYITNFGTINISNSGGIGISNLSGIGRYSTIDNRGEIIISNGDGIKNNSIFENSGTITIQNSDSGVGFTNSGTINNSHIINIQNTGGTGIFNSGIINNNLGTISIQFLIGILENSGTITNNVSSLINNSNIIDNSGILTNHGRIDNFTIINNHNTITNDGFINNYSGTINNYCDATYLGNQPIGNPVVFSICSTADLSIQKIPLSDTTQPGGNISYDITVTNNGPDTAENVIVTDIIPEHLTVDGYHFLCTDSSGIVACNLDSIDAGQSKTVRINFNTNTDALVSQISNTASVSSDSDDPNPDDNSDTSVVTNNYADLRLTKTSSVSQIGQNGLVTYSIRVVNDGPSTSNTIKLFDYLPDGATFVEYRSYPDVIGCLPTDGCIVKGGLGGIPDLSFFDIILTPGQMLTMEIDVLLDGISGTSLENTAFVESLVFDPDMSNNQASVSVLINNPPIANAGGPYTIQNGDRLALDGSLSSDPDTGDSIVSYEWDLNYDGIYEITGSNPVISTDALSGFTLDVPHQILLKVTDSFGAPNRVETTFTINSKLSPPVIPPSANVDPGATIGDGTVLGENVIVSKDSTIGQQVTIGDNSNVDKNVKVGDGSQIGAGVSISKDGDIGTDVQIGNNVSIDKNVKIGNGAIIGNNVVIGKDSTIAAGAVIPDGTVLAKNSIFP